MSNYQILYIIIKKLLIFIKTKTFFAEGIGQFLKSSDLRMIAFSTSLFQTKISYLLYYLLPTILVICPNIFEASVQNQYESEELRIGGIFDQDQYQLDTLQVRYDYYVLFLYYTYLMNNNKQLLTIISNTFKR